MKTKIIPFDLEMAKDIQDGKIKGKIKTRGSKDVDEIAFFRTHPNYSIYAIINGVCHSFTKEGYERSWDKSGTWAGDLVLEVPDNEPQFKPFDKVLVRNDDEEIWQPRLYEMYSGGTEKHYCQDGVGYLQCIPYEGHEYLVSTTDKPKEE